MYALCCKIKIKHKPTGDAQANTAETFTFEAVNDVQIKRSINELAASAVIKVPVTAVVKKSGEADVHVETRNQIGIGDEVEIKLGYNGKYETEFTGFVKQVNCKIPVEIECEDHFFLTRKGELNFGEEETTTVKKLIETILPDVRLASCVNLTLNNFSVKNQPGAWALAKLKKEYGLNVYFDVEGRLHVEKYFEEKEPKKVKYRLRHNVIKDTDLKYLMAGDVKLSIKALCYLEDGSMIEGKIGEDGGEKKTLYYYDVKDEEELKMLARQEYNKLISASYGGKIETFLFPHCLPGMVAVIDDPKYHERNGDYYVESTEVKFGAAGARRILTIGMKV